MGLKLPMGVLIGVILVVSAGVAPNVRYRRQTPKKTPESKVYKMQPSKVPMLAQLAVGCGGYSCFTNMKPSMKTQERVKGVVQKCVSSTIRKAQAFQKDLPCDVITKVLRAAMESPPAITNDDAVYIKNRIPRGSTRTRRSSVTAGVKRAGFPQPVRKVEQQKQDPKFRRRSNDRKSEESSTETTPSIETTTSSQSTTVFESPFTNTETPSDDPVPKSSVESESSVELELSSEKPEILMSTEEKESLAKFKSTKRPKISYNTDPSLMDDDSVISNEDMEFAESEKIETEADYGSGDGIIDNVEEEDEKEEEEEGAEEKVEEDVDMEKESKKEDPDAILEMFGERENSFRDKKQSQNLKFNKPTKIEIELDMLDGLDEYSFFSQVVDRFLGIGNQFGQDKMMSSSLPTSPTFKDRVAPHIARIFLMQTMEDRMKDILEDCVVEELNFLNKDKEFNVIAYMEFINMTYEEDHVERQRMTKLIQICDDRTKDVGADRPRVFISGCLVPLVDNLCAMDDIANSVNYFDEDSPMIKEEMRRMKDEMQSARNNDNILKKISIESRKDNQRAINFPTSPPPTTIADDLTTTFNDDETTGIDNAKTTFVTNDVITTVLPKPALPVVSTETDSLAKIKAKEEVSSSADEFSAENEGPKGIPIPGSAIFNSTEDGFDTVFDKDYIVDDFDSEDNKKSNIEEDSIDEDENGFEGSGSQLVD